MGPSGTASDFFSHPLPYLPTPALTPIACPTPPWWLAGVRPLSRPALSCPRGAVRRDGFLTRPGASGRRGARLLSRHPSPPRLWLFYVGRGGCRVLGDVSAVLGVRPSRGHAFWPRVSSPLLSGYLAVAFRRGGLKTPGGSPFRPQGRGAVGPVGKSVGRSVGWLALRLRDPPPAAAAVPEAAAVLGGGCPEPPLGARGDPPRAAGLPDFRGSALSLPVAGSCVVPVVFRSRPFFFFFSSHVSCFVSRWPA